MAKEPEEATVSSTNKAATAPRGRPGPKPGTEAARRGGQAAFARYGSDFYARIGKQGGSTVRQRHGSDFYQRIGHMGGQATRDKLGPDHYSRIGRMGGKKGRQRGPVLEGRVRASEFRSRHEQEQAN